MPDSNLTAAQRFGRIVNEAAEHAGYDMTPGGNGRAAIASAADMSEGAVDRMLKGITLPRPSQMLSVARFIGMNVHDLLTGSGILQTPEHAGTARHLPPSLSVVSGVDIEANPGSVHVTIRGPLAEVAKIRAWIAARASRITCAVDDDPEHPGWTVATLTVLAPEQ